MNDWLDCFQNWKLRICIIEDIDESARFKDQDWVSVFKKVNKGQLMKVIVECGC